MCKTVKVIKLPRGSHSLRRAYARQTGRVVEPVEGRKGGAGYGSETKASQKAGPQCNCGNNFIARRAGEAARGSVQQGIC